VPQGVLDKGFVTLVDWMGDERSICSAARVSYQEGTRPLRDDRALIRHLMREWHTGPLEMCELRVHIRAPIFVARQIFRHRTGSFNEISARYSVIPDDFYIPTLDTLSAQSKSNKQGRGVLLPEETRRSVHSILAHGSNEGMKSYRSALSKGLSREIARVSMPVGTYTEWHLKMDLHNLLHLLRLRLDTHAQYETRLYAERIAALVQLWVPVVWEAFVDYRLESMTLSRGEVQALWALVVEDPTRYSRESFIESSEDAGLCRREMRELRAKLDRLGLVKVD
jgi:thymidylate synthase (FAD)